MGPNHVPQQTSIDWSPGVWVKITGVDLLLFPPNTVSPVQIIPTLAGIVAHSRPLLCHHYKATVANEMGARCRIGLAIM